MKKQTLTDNEFDTMISKLLASDAPSMRANFSDSVMAEIEKTIENEKILDKTTDTLLAQQHNFPNITESTMSRIAQIRQSVLEKIASYSVAVSIAVCAIMSVIATTSNSSFSQGVLTEDDFAEMSKIDEEINNITLLVMQEEILDIIRK